MQKSTKVTGLKADFTQSRLSERERSLNKLALLCHVLRCGCETSYNLLRNTTTNLQPTTIPALELYSLTYGGAQGVDCK